jgi:hypothetical protein
VPSEHRRGSSLYAAAKPRRIPPSDRAVGFPTRPQSRATFRSGLATGRGPAPPHGGGWVEYDIEDGGGFAARCRRSASHLPSSGDDEVVLVDRLRCALVQGADLPLAGGPIEVVGAPDDVEREVGRPEPDVATVFDVAEATDVTVEVKGPLTLQCVACREMLEGALGLALAAVATDTVVAILRIERAPLNRKLLLVSGWLDDFSKRLKWYSVTAEAGIASRPNPSAVRVAVTLSTIADRLPMSSFPSVG